MSKQQNIKNLTNDMSKLDLNKKPAATTTTPASKQTIAQKAAAAQKAAQAKKAAAAQQKKKATTTNNKNNDDDVDLDGLMLSAQQENAAAALSDDPAVVARVMGSREAIADKRQEAHIARKLGQRPEEYTTPQNGDLTQTTPPTIPVARFFAEPAPGFFHEKESTSTDAVGDADQHDTITTRTTKAEKRSKDLINEQQLQHLREAAEVHRQVRQDIQLYLQPGVKLLDVAAHLERATHDLLGYDAQNPLARSRGFPTGLNVSNLTTGRADVAHWAPNPGDNTVIHKDDVIKIDFGTQINGCIIDSAFTWHMNEQFDPIVEATKEATAKAIAMAGVDVRLGDIGGLVAEIITSYEMEINGQMVPVKPIRNLYGHSIGNYRIHAGKSVPLVNNHDQTKMEEGELFAIETFAACGKLDRVVEDNNCSHFMRNFSVDTPIAKQPGAVKLWNFINEKFGTLAFCPRWILEHGYQDYPLALQQLVNVGSIDPYAPLVLPKGTHSSQSEHTIHIGKNSTEVLSAGWDY